MGVAPFGAAACEAVGARPMRGSVGCGAVTSRDFGSAADANCPDGRLGAGAGTPRGVGGMVLALGMPGDDVDTGDTGDDVDDAATGAVIGAGAILGRSALGISMVGAEADAAAAEGATGGGAAAGAAAGGGATAGGGAAGAGWGGAAAGDGLDDGPGIFVHATDESAAGSLSSAEGLAIFVHATDESACGS